MGQALSYENPVKYSKVRNKISVASRESQCKYWYISNKNDLTSKISVYQCVWSIPWLKYVKGTGLQNKVFEYLTFKSGNFGKMSRESQWNGWKGFANVFWTFSKLLVCSSKVFFDVFYVLKMLPNFSYVTFWRNVFLFIWFGRIENVL